VSELVSSLFSFGASRGLTAEEQLPREKSHTQAELFDLNHLI